MHNLQKSIRRMFDFASAKPRRPQRTSSNKTTPAEVLEQRALLSAITVTSAADTTAEDGMVTLREAIAAANFDISIDGSEAGSGFDTIQFDASLSGQSIVLGEGEIFIRSDLRINGLGAAASTIDGAALSRIFQVSPGSLLEIRDITLTNGRDTGADSDSLSGAAAESGIGGAILNDGGTLMIVDSVIANSAVYGGDSLSGTPGSRGGGAFGAAVANLEGQVSVVDSVIESNSAVSGNSTGSGNSGNAVGGGVYSRNGSVTIRNSTLDSNTTQAGTVASGTSGISAGGGLAAISATVFVQASTFSNNDSELGGAIFRSATGSTVTSLDILNSTISNNTGDIGAGLYHGDSGMTSIDYSTIVENQAATRSGGLYSVGHIEIGRSILTGNTAPTDANINANSTSLNTVVSTGDNIFGDITGVAVDGETSNVENVAMASVVYPLADNGGPTQTHMLVPGSIAINTVTTDEFNLADQRGDVRPADGTADIGAIEVSTEDVNDIAADLDVSLGLITTGDLFEDWGGRGEKWMKGADGAWFFILPNGELYEWDGSGGANGTLLTTLPTIFHGAPDLLYHAHTIQLDRDLGLQSTGNYYENWGGAGEKWLKDREGAWYFILPTGQLHRWDGSSGANGTFVHSLGSEFHTNPELLINAHAIGIDSQFGFEQGTGAFNTFGRSEKWFEDRNGDAFFVLPGGLVHRWDGRASATGTLISKQGSDVYTDPALLYNAYDSVMSEWTGI